jgi:hypothetical protein
MKLKTIMASLLALGLSDPVMAAAYRLDTSYQLDVMRDQMNKVDLILDQNQPGGFDQPCGWTCRINVSGWINTDAYLANRPPVFLGLNSGYITTELPGMISNPLLIPTMGRASDLLLNNANLFLDARVNNWVTANLSLIYTSLMAVPSSQGFYGIANSLFVYHPVPSGNVVTRSIDTAYATISNFQVSPIYFRIGKEYVPFGQYDPYAFVQSENPTQLMTEINAATAQLGFIIPNGFYGSVYTFAGNPKLNDAGSTHRIQNGGVDLGFSWNTCNSKLNVDAGWLANIADSNFLSAYYLNSLIEGTNVPGLPNQRTPAWNVNTDLTLGFFDVNGHYLATTRNLVNPLFMRQPGLFGAPFSLGKPNVWGLETGLTFPVMAHQSRLALGYQQTTHLANFLPKRRIYADYLVNISKWFDLGIAVFQDRDYKLDEGAVIEPPETFERLVLHPGATGNKSTVGQLRASIKFA